MGFLDDLLNPIGAAVGGVEHALGINNAPKAPVRTPAPAPAAKAPVRTPSPTQMAVNAVANAFPVVAPIKTEMPIAVPAAQSTAQSIAGVIPQIEGKPSVTSSNPVIQKVTQAVTGNKTIPSLGKQGSGQLESVGVPKKIAESPLGSVVGGAEAVANLLPSSYGISKTVDAGELAAKAAQARDALSTANDALGQTGKVNLPSRSAEAAAEAGAAQPTTKAPRGFVESVKNSPEVSAQTRSEVAGSYTPKNNADMVTASHSLIDQGLDSATSKVMSDLSQTAGRITPQQVSDAIAVAKAHDAAGNFGTATAIYDRLAEHGTVAGQKVQALSLLSSRTPEGMHYSAVKALNNADENYDAFFHNASNYLA